MSDSWSMEQSNSSKIVHLALGAPGCGKTHALIQYLPTMLNDGQRVLIVLPTLDLSSSVSRRCTQAGIEHRVINSDVDDRAADQLKNALATRSFPIVISTHASLMNILPDVLSGWTLVVDELPLVLDFPDYQYEPAELPDLFDCLHEIDQRLEILEGRKPEIERRVKIQRLDASGSGQNSAISKSLARIYQALLSGHPVFIDDAQSNGNRHVRPVIESKLWERFKQASSVHLLAAHVEGSLFDTLAKVHGFTYATSPIKPDDLVYSGQITIYPLVSKGHHFSKSLALKPSSMQLKENSLAIQDTFVIDLMVEAALEQSVGQPLLFANNWAKFRWLKPKAVMKCDYDSRGLNEYSKHSDAIVIFGGNPSPADSLALAYLSEKYGTDFTQPFIVTRLLEPSLQSVARTAVRTKGNDKSIQLFVQDERVSDFLLRNYMGNAQVNWEVASKIPHPKDGRKKVHVDKARALELIASGATNADISEALGIHRNSVSKWRQEAQQNK